LRSIANNDGSPRFTDISYGDFLYSYNPCYGYSCTNITYDSYLQVYTHTIHVIDTRSTRNRLQWRCDQLNFCELLTYFKYS
jgi:hypothetical protein